MLHEVALVGLRHVDITTDPANIASQRVILRNRGRRIESVVKPAAFGGGESWRYRLAVPIAAQ